MFAAVVSLFVFTFSCVCGVSTCSSNIILNQQQVAFHVDGLDELHTRAALFCQKYSIAGDDCSQIVQYHKNKCFAPVASLTDTTISGSVTNDQMNPISVDIGNNIIEIDYSQKYGPVLTVYLENSSTNLQAFHGETSAQAVKRFCGMLDLSISHCKEIESKFRELNGEAVGPITGDSNIVGETTMTSKWIALVVHVWKLIKDKCNANMGLLIFVVMLAFVILEHFNPPQQ